ncbi:formyltransferase family protein [Patescibacteria group bacterium]
MKKIIFLGSKPIGYKCLEYLIKNSGDLDIILDGVLTNDNINFASSLSIKSICKKNNIRIIENLDKLLSLKDIDILISVQYHKILKKCHIDIARDISINLHMAPLPEYRGCNQFSFAILNNDAIFGTTIHRLEEGIDSGSIIAEKRFNIPKNCFVDELYNLTFKKSLKLFKEEICNIISSNFTLTPQETFLGKRNLSLHYRKEIKDIKKINLSWDKEKIERHIRATAMPGFDPPYAYIGNEKINIIRE